MTHHYRASLETESGSTPLGWVSYTSMVPPGWEGLCCYCRRRLTVADWRTGMIVAAGNGNPWHCLCLGHLKGRGREYRDALCALAAAMLSEGGVR